MPSLVIYFSVLASVSSKLLDLVRFQTNTRSLYLSPVHTHVILSNERTNRTITLFRNSPPKANFFDPISKIRTKLYSFLISSLISKLYKIPRILSTMKLQNPSISRFQSEYLHVYGHLRDNGKLKIHPSNLGPLHP